MSKFGIFQYSCQNLVLFKGTLLVFCSLSSNLSNFWSKLSPTNFFQLHHHKKKLNLRHFRLFFRFGLRIKLKIAILRHIHTSQYPVRLFFYSFSVSHNLKKLIFKKLNICAYLVKPMEKGEKEKAIIKWGKGSDQIALLYLSRLQRQNRQDRHRLRFNLLS